MFRGPGYHDCQLRRHDNPREMPNLDAVEFVIVIPNVRLIQSCIVYDARVIDVHPGIRCGLGEQDPNYHGWRFDEDSTYGQVDNLHL